MRGGSLIKEEVEVEAEDVVFDWEVFAWQDGLCNVSVVVFWHLAWQPRVSSISSHCLLFSMARVSSIK